MSSPRLLWPIFFLLTVVTLLATGWVSMRVIRLEQQRIEEARRAKVEENVSLALWRIDSLVAPLVAGENARPFQEYAQNPANWYDQSEQEPKLENGYFTLELPSDNSRPFEKVHVVNGVAPKPLRNLRELTRLLADLPEPTIRLSDAPILKLGTEPYQSQEKAMMPAMPSVDIGKTFSGKTQAARSKKDFQARQSTINRIMNYSANAGNLKQQINVPVQMPNSMQMPGNYNESLMDMDLDALGVPQMGVPQAPFPPNASAPMQAAPSPPSQAAPTSPAPNSGTFFMPMLRSWFASMVVGQVEYLPPAQQTAPSTVLQENQQEDQQEDQQQQVQSLPALNNASVPQMPQLPQQAGAAVQQPVVPTYQAPGNTPYYPSGNQPPTPYHYPPPATWNPYQAFPAPSLGSNDVAEPQQSYPVTPQDFSQQTPLRQQAIVPPTVQAVLVPEEGVWAPMQPVCVGNQLFLLRRVRLGGRSLLQGCLLDWPRLAQFLEKQVADLLPNARLALDDKKNSPGRMLASLPVRIEPGSLPEVETAQLSATLTPVLASVTIAFGCVLLSIGAFAVLLVGMLRLGRRRSEFVTAVTHELRTPLTTFRMYSEMLAEGMVEEGSQKSYLQTLESEADRLTHLVENMLSSARLERGRHAGRLETLPIGELITPIASRLSKRCDRAQMRLKVEISEAVNGTTIQTNPSAVEQILWNLVDNACKYAITANDRAIRMVCEIQDEKYLTITVSDQGPGIPREVRRRLFCGFSKTASEAARSAPGVGLGLALSRRLARDLGGNLELLPTDRGASFMLRLELH